MNPEKPQSLQQNSLELQRQELFKKAALELAKDLQRKNTGDSESQSNASANVILQKRWSTARTLYWNIIGAIGITPAKDYHEAEPYDYYVASVQEGYASRATLLWKELEGLFATGNVRHRPHEEEAQMSDGTAKELVIMLTKVQKYK
ncbi:MAG: hypothetical protein Q7S50_04165 [bacterium]|nr:hypothetical protein [bacterium]